jgi:hypothetical protein
VSCSAINDVLYRSSCQTRNIWVYAKVIRHGDDEGWNLIKVRGSCNCAYYNKTNLELFREIINDKKR